MNLAIFQCSNKTERYRGDLRFAASASVHCKSTLTHLIIVYPLHMHRYLVEEMFVREIYILSQRMQPSMNLEFFALLGFD